MVGVMSAPFSGAIYYGREDAYGEGITSSGLVERCISNLVTNVRIGTGDVATEFYSIDSPEVAGFVQSMWKPTLHVEWVWQPNTFSLVSDCMDRTTCTLQPLAFEVGINNGCGGTDQWYDFQGCMCKSITLNATVGEPYIWSADFSVASVVPAGAAVGSAPSPLVEATYPFARFNTAGSVLWTGLTDTFHITQSINLTVNNNLNEYFTVGAQGVTYAFPGKKEITGSCDLSIDDGGENIWADVMDMNNFATVVFDAGVAATGYDVLTLTDGIFKNLEITLDSSGEGLISSIPFQSKSIAVSTS